MSLSRELNKKHKNDFIFQFYDIENITNIEDSIEYYKMMLLNKVIDLLVFDGLPDTINPMFFNATRLLNGTVGITKYKAKLIAVQGGYGGQPNIYNIPTNYVWANNVTSGESYIGNNPLINKLPEIVVFNNTSLFQSMYPLISRTAEFLANIDTSLLIAIVNKRATRLMTATSDIQKNQVEHALEQIREGKFGVVIDNKLFDNESINAIDIVGNINNTSSTIDDIVRLYENIMSRFFQEIGIPRNEKFKKAQVNDSELTGLETSSTFNITDMYNESVKACEACNKLFNTNISVKINPILDNAKSEDSKESEVIDDETILQN